MYVVNKTLPYIRLSLKQEETKSSQRFIVPDVFTKTIATFVQLRGGSVVGYAWHHWETVYFK